MNHLTDTPGLVLGLAGFRLLSSIPMSNASGFVARRRSACSSPVICKSLMARTLAVQWSHSYSLDRFRSASDGLRLLRIEQLGAQPLVVQPGCHSFEHRERLLVRAPGLVCLALRLI